MKLIFNNNWRYIQKTFVHLQLLNFNYTYISPPAPEFHLWITIFNFEIGLSVKQK